MLPALTASRSHPLPAALGDVSLALLDEAQAGLFIHQHKRICFVNAFFASLIGTSPERLIGTPSIDLVLQADRPQVVAQIRRRLLGAQGEKYEVRFLRSDGSVFEAHVSGRRIDLGGRPAHLVTVVDISRLKLALRRAEWNAGMLARTEALCRTGSFEVTLPGGQVELSNGLRALAGLDEHAPGGAIDALAWVPAEERAQVEGVWRGAAPGEAFEFQHRIECRDGRRLVVLHRGVLRESDEGLRGVAILQDITAQREAERQLQQLANHDEVTGLPNRAAFLNRVDQAIQAARAAEQPLALLAIDVARVDELSATMGYGAGDTLAIALASRLVRLCARGETVARLAGGEFAVLLNAQCIDQADVIARASAFQSALQAPERLGSAEILPTCIVGIGVFPGDAPSAPLLLQAAQTARLGARGAEPAGIAFFRPEASAQALRTLQLEAALRHAVERGELHLQYQPQVALADGAICGVEALLRWNSAEFGAVSPVEFIPIAERSDLILSIGDWVLERACEQVRAWRSAGLPQVRMGVNLSPLQLQHPDIAERIQAIVLRSGVDPSCLGIEVTESTLMADLAQARRALGELKAIGIELSLDDFGTGYSSLSCLRTLPIDIVKVDRSFVDDVTSAPEQASVTRAIITMAHGLQMRVLAEGVETADQLSLLLANGCDQIQGYYFSRPLPAAGVEALLRENRRLPERFTARRRHRRTLLLVDADHTARDALADTLSRDDWQVEAADSGEAALELMARAEVDLVIAEQDLPAMSGVDFLRRCATLYPRVQRIVLSATADFQPVADAIGDGTVYRFLARPWDDDQLRGHVARAFRVRELADENRQLVSELDSAVAKRVAAERRLQNLLGRDREHAELLEASAASAREMLDLVPAPMLGLDADDRVVLVNQAAQEQLPGCARWLGQPVQEALPAALLEAMHTSGCETGPVLIDGRPFTAQWRITGEAAARACLLVLLPQRACP